jgi:hypothetical protein
MHQQTSSWIFGIGQESSMKAHRSHLHMSLIYYLLSRSRKSL